MHRCTAAPVTRCSCGAHYSETLFLHKYLIISTNARRTTGGQRVSGRWLFNNKVGYCTLVSNTGVSDLFNLVEYQFRAVSPKPLPIAARFGHFCSQSHALQLILVDRIDPDHRILEFGALFRDLDSILMYIIIERQQGGILNTEWKYNSLGSSLQNSNYNIP